MGNNMEQIEDKKELEILELYLEELKALPRIELEEKEILFQDLKTGKEKAREKLTEAYLLTAVEMAAGYKNRGVGLADLIQEANVGLMAALSGSEEQIDDNFIRKSMDLALKKAVQEETQAEEIGEYLVENVNRLNEAARELAEINGKEPTIEELSQHLHMTEEEVREFMKISLDASSFI